MESLGPLTVEFHSLSMLNNCQSQFYHPYRYFLRDGVFNYGKGVVILPLSVWQNGSLTFWVETEADRKVSKDIYLYIYLVYFLLSRRFLYFTASWESALRDYLSIVSRGRSSHKKPVLNKKIKIVVRRWLMGSKITFQPSHSPQGLFNCMQPHSNVIGQQYSENGNQNLSDTNILPLAYRFCLQIYLLMELNWTRSPK